MQYGIQNILKQLLAVCSATVLFNELTQTLARNPCDLRQEVHAVPRRDTGREPSLDLTCRHSQKMQTKPLPRKPNTCWGKNTLGEEQLQCWEGNSPGHERAESLCTTLFFGHMYRGGERRREGENPKLYVPVKVSLTLFAMQLRMLKYRRASWC